MSNTISNLKVRFSADTRNFKKDMDSGKAAVQGFSRNAGSAFERFASIFGVNLKEVNYQMKQAKQQAAAMKAGLKGATAGTNIFTKALKFLKIALISTGIGAIVVALGSLIVYFTKTQRGADKVKKVIASMGAIFDVLIDRASSFGEGIFKIFTGKFKEGWQALKNASKGVGEELKKEAKAAWELQEALQALERDEISFIKTKQKLRDEISDLILKTRDESIAQEERLKYIKQAQTLQKQLSDEEYKLSERRVEIMRQQQELGENMLEDDRELAEAEANLNTIRKESNDKMRELVNRYNEMTNKINASTKALNKNREAQEKLTALQQSGERNGELFVYSAKLVVNEDGTKEWRNILENVFENDKLNQKIEEAKVAITDFQGFTIKKGDLLRQAFNNIAVGFGESLGLMIAGAEGAKSINQIVGEVFGNMAIQIGKVAIAAGIAFFELGQAFQVALTTPAAALGAVAAGIALVAIGTAVKSSFNNIASNPGGGGAYSSSSGVYDSRTLIPQSSGYNSQPQTIHIELDAKFKQSGADLVSVINKRLDVDRISG